jgi:hypothetical protein
MAPAVRGIPTILALAINMGVALLLFTQALYGSLLYTSSILVGTWWILLVPLLVLAYYGTYIGARQSGSMRFARAVPLVTAAILLWAIFVFVNNMTLMEQPERWHAFFGHRAGTMLNMADPVLVPRYLHFVVGSAAVAGLFTALLSHFRGGNDGTVHSGLRIFAGATIIQTLTGFWFLLSLPEGIMRLFTGGSALHTAFLAAGVLLAFGAVIAALRGKAVAAAIHLIALVAAMAVTRANLRTAYLENLFNTGTAPFSAEYGPLVLFLASLAAVAAAVIRMLKMIPKGKGGTGR